ncbi:MAG: hypothetical protein KKE16_00165 [Firmicutes bacterium]|nr:hypothetical protein [Bacillota bacterium]
MNESRHVKKYFIRILIGSAILLLSIFFAWQLLVNNEPKIEVVSINIISDITVIDDVYQVEVGDEIEIEIIVKDQTNLTIRYLEINDQKYHEKDINYDLSYMEPDVTDDGTRKLSVTYIVIEGDEFIEVKDVRLYLRGFLYVGHRLDLEDFGKFDLNIE